MGVGVQAAWRSLRRRPILTTSLVAILGFAIAVNSALFAIFDGLLFRPLPYRDAQQIVHLRAPLHKYLARRERIGEIASAVASLPLVDATYVKRRAVFQPGGRAVVDLGIRPVFVSTKFFDLLGAYPSVGRPFTEADAVVHPRPVILGDGLWRRLYAADANIVGRNVRLPGALEDESWTVVGVMPRYFDFPTGSNFWLPYNPDEFLPSVVPDFAKLAGSASVEAIRSSLPDVDVLTLREFARPAGASSIGFLLLSTLLLLLAAWAQVAALAYARTAERTLEFSIRIALGAKRRDLQRAVAREGALVAGLSLGFGLLIGAPLATAVTALMPVEMTVGQRLAPSWRVLAFCCVVQATGLMIWLIAASELVRRRAERDVLQPGREASRARGSARTRYGLLALQVAVTTALILLTAAALRSYQRVRHVDLGFEPDGLFAFPMPPPTAERGSSAAEYRKVETLYAQLALESRARALSLPGVESASFAAYWPMATIPERRILIDAESGSSLEVVSQAVGRTYMATVGARLIEGRSPTPQEVSQSFWAGGNRVAVVNRTLASSLQRRGPILGQVLDLSVASRVTVVGVVDDVEDETLDGVVSPTLYTFLPETGYGPLLLVRLGSSGRTGPIQAMLSEVWGTARDSLETIALTSVVSRASVGHRSRSLLMGIISLLSLPVMIVGVAGAVRYAIERESSDHAVRLALGAHPNEVQRKVITRCLRYGGAGVATGLVGGATVAEGAASLVAGVAATDWLTALASTGIVLASILGGAVVGVRPISRIQPTDLLRQA